MKEPKVCDESVVEGKRKGEIFYNDYYVLVYSGLDQLSKFDMTATILSLSLLNQRLLRGYPEVQLLVDKEGHFRNSRQCVLMFPLGKIIISFLVLFPFSYICPNFFISTYPNSRLFQTSGNSLAALHNTYLGAIPHIPRLHSL